MKKIIDKMASIQMGFSIVLLIIFLLCVVMQVFTRYVPLVEILWTEEIAIYAFMWAVFMGASVLVYKNEHFAFSFFRSRVQKEKKLIVETLIHVLMIIFTIYIAKSGYELTAKFWNWTFTSLPMISQRYTWSALLVSGVTMTIYLVYNMIVEFQNYFKSKNK